ncbi:ubiquitin carboxyl-terminal hydrolase 36-like [Hetaerina americana]|uniref:ubiquitin carboxyl-terminal hydrolase 36-like n=1 Tax=Hetaerina americana TaxID=62018 RepID=UPI003A7F1D7B
MAVTKGLESISCALKRQFESTRYMEEDDNQKPSLDSRLFSAASRVLETKVEFEASQWQSNTVLANLKGKYKVLLPPKKTTVGEVSAGSSNIITNVQADKRYESAGSPKKNSVKPSPADSSTPRAPPVSLFPEDGVKLGWKGNEPVGAGMINLGNTCYLNSTLQALFHVPSFCNWLASEPRHNGTGKCDQAFISGDMCLICAMVSTLRITQTHSGNVMKPVLIYGRLKSICKHLSHGHQEDAHEFLRFLIEGMERCYLLRFKGKKLDNLVKETTPLHRIFGGYLRNEVVCHSCGTISTTFQLFQDLFLDIRHTNSLMESMQAFFSRERLEADDRNDSYKCEECKRKGNCSKRVYIQTPPKVLCFQLKRFTAMGKKIMKHISYPLKLDLSPFVYMRTLNKNGDIISPLPKVRRPIPYKLVSLVTHYGNAMTCGHYTAVGRSAKGSYFTFDDSLVRPASLNSALGACAYILMYEMEAGWNIGLGDSSEERINNNSLRPSKSLSELSKLNNSQPSLFKSVVHSEQKANSLLGVLPQQHSKEIQGTTASTAPQEVKSEATKSSLSKMETDRLTPAMPKRENLESSCTSLGIPEKITLNGCLKKNFSNVTSKPSPSTVSCKKISESHFSNSSPSKSQDATNLSKRPVPLQLLSEGKVKKDTCGLLKESDSGSQKELELKNCKPTLNSCKNVKQKSSQKEPKNVTPKQLNNDQNRRISTKRKPSTCGLEGGQQSPFPIKKQLTLPDLLNRKNNASNSVPRLKIKTLKDWLEIRSTSKDERIMNKGLQQPKLLSQVQDVKSTVSGWKVTEQNTTSSNPVLDLKTNNVTLKRKKEVAIMDGNKRKKMDPAANAQLWRTFFKKKISSNKLITKVGDPGSKKIKWREKNDVDCAPELPDSVRSHGLFQKV